MESPFAITLGYFLVIVFSSLTILIADLNNIFIISFYLSTIICIILLNLKNKSIKILTLFIIIYLIILFIPLLFLSLLGNILFDNTNVFDSNFNIKTHYYCEHYYEIYSYFNNLDYKYYYSVGKYFEIVDKNDKIYLYFNYQKESTKDKYYNIINNYKCEEVSN